VNGDPLEESDFPLKLAGADLAGGERVAQITKILIHFNENTVSTEETVAVDDTPVVEAPMIDASFEISGKVNAPFTISGEEIASMEVLGISVEHPSSGETVDYVGVSLNTLLDMAEPQADAEKVVFTASDGYSMEVSLAELRACSDCIIAINGEEGYFMDVLPGFEGGTWVKYLVKIDIQ